VWEATCKAQYDGERMPGRSFAYNMEPQTKALTERDALPGHRHHLSVWPLMLAYTDATPADDRIGTQ
jgi:hypothetical protein